MKKHKNHPTKPNERKLRAVEEAKKSKRYYRILTGLFIAFCIHHYVIESWTIGHDPRYAIFVFGLPMVIGLICCYLVFRNYIKNYFADNQDSLVYKFLAVLLFLAEGALLSYITICFAANVTFDYINKQVAGNSPEDTVYCNIDSFNTNKNSGGTIWFKYQNSIEPIEVSYQKLKDYQDKGVSKYQVRLKIRKGLWNYAIVDRWHIEEVGTGEK